MEIKKVAICGAGVMGSGIALNAILCNYQVLLFDIEESATSKGKNYIETQLNKMLEKGKITLEQKNNAQNLLHFSNNLSAVIADLIIEAVVEKLDVKKNLFARLEEQNADNCILASNTSSIPITQISRELKNPKRFVGIHFFNPAQIMKLVEVINGVETSDETTITAKMWAESLGKTTVVCQDSPGFIVNRVARHYYVEALKILEQNIATIEDIDALMESSGFKLGPFKLMDLIGVETNFSVTSSMYEQFFYDEKFRPSRIQKQKVDAGHWGQKSKKGFYSYE